MVLSCPRALLAALRLGTADVEESLVEEAERTGAAPRRKSRALLGESATYLAAKLFSINRICTLAVLMGRPASWLSVLDSILPSATECKR